MTYTFKIARRLAMARGTIAIVLLAAFAACQPGDLAEGLAPPDVTATLDIVHTTPDSATLSPGDTLQFSAYGQTVAGDSVGVFVGSWNATGGTISSAGLFQADSTPGTYQVSASAELLTGNPGRRLGHSWVRVRGNGNPRLTGVTVSPDAATVSARQSQIFSAFGNMSDGSTSPVSVSWIATGGNITPDGLYQAGTRPGAFVVIATEGSGLADTASVTISDPGNPQLTRIDITPQTTTLSAGQTQSYTAIGRLSDGSNTTVTVSWTATGGSIDNAGRYVAGIAPGSFRVIATETSGLVDTANVVISAPPPPNPGHPNEPSGFTRFYENAYTVAPALGIENDNGAAIDGCWYMGSGSYGISTDPTTPSGDGVVLDIRYRAGHPSGVGPGTMQEWDLCPQVTNTEYSKVYIDMWIKMAGGPNGDLLNWEQHPVMTKFTGQWGSGRNGQGSNASEMYGLIWNDGSGNLFQTEWRFGWVNINFPPSARGLGQNVNTSLRIRAGQWHRIEILMEMNSTPGSTDGRFKWWLDGTLALDYSDVTFNSAASPSGFYGRHNAPTWGGSATNSKTREDHIYYDHMYMSALP